MDKLENYGQEELVNIDKCTIEHILPQNPNLSQKWQDMLGPNWKEIQSKYLHSIGNLTLTAYNPDLGDMSFLEREMMSMDSPIVPYDSTVNLGILRNGMRKRLRDVQNT